MGGLCLLSPLDVGCIQGGAPGTVLLGPIFLRKKLELEKGGNGKIEDLPDRGEGVEYAEI